MIEVYGHSDDIIVVRGGKLTDEFYPDYNDPKVLLEFSDGTILSVEYNHEGCWVIEPQVTGPAYVDREPYTDPDDCYSDVVHLRSDLEWVKMHSEGLE